MNRKPWMAALAALTTFANREDGQDLVEYSLLTGFLALAAVGLLSGIGTTVKGVWVHVSSGIALAGRAAS